jgi:hypothetical protein
MSVFLPSLPFPPVCLACFPKGSGQKLQTLWFERETHMQMARFLHRKVLIQTLFSFSFFIFLLGACAPASTELRKEGFALLEKGFSYEDGSPSLNRTVELSNVRVHIVGDQNLVGPGQARDSHPGLVGYSTSENDVYLLGKVVGGKIIVNQAVLGHELMHLLHFKDPAIANPDTLDRLEMCAARSGRC